MTTKRYYPEPVLLLLTMGDAGPPLCPQVRADVVRLAMARFASNRGYWRMAMVFYSSDEHSLKSLLLALQELREGEMVDLDPAYYAKSLRDASAAWGDQTFLRLASIAGDVIDWDSSDEWTIYVEPAWNTLCDEVQFEREELENNRFLVEEYYCVKRQNNQGYSKHEAHAQGIADARRWRPGSRRDQ